MEVQGLLGCRHRSHEDAKTERIHRGSEVRASATDFSHVAPWHSSSQPQMMGHSEAVAESNAEVSGQAYSMLSYAKTFCEDLYGFLMQLPPLGKAFVVVVLLGFWLLFRG